MKNPASTKLASMVHGGGLPSPNANKDRKEIANLKPSRGAPFGLWYQERAHAVSYAEWVREKWTVLRSWSAIETAALLSGESSRTG
jgi:hypothetical protein